MTAKAAKTVKYGSRVDGIREIGCPDLLKTSISDLMIFSTAEPDQYGKRFLSFLNEEAIE